MKPNSSRDSFVQQILKGLSNVAFSFIMVGVLIFTIIAIRYEAPDPWASPDKALEKVLSAVSNATLHADDSVLATGEDFAAPDPVVAISLQSVQEEVEKANVSSFVCSTDGLVNCSDPRILFAIAAYNLQHFPDLAFFSYGVPVRGSADTECDVSWKFRSRKETSLRKYRDYRRFSFSVADVDADSGSCNYTVVSDSGWHSGKNAKPPRKSSGKQKQKQKQEEEMIVTEIRPLPAEELEFIDDAVSRIADPASFLQKKYLFYGRGGDHCKPMNHYLWSFLCALGEAIYLNRTMVVDLNLCLSATNNPGHEGDEDGKDFRYYFDYAHLKSAASVVEQERFLEEWKRWNGEHPGEHATMREVTDYKVTPMELKGEESTIVMRKFEKEEPENYWYRVCEGETEKVIERPWQMLWKSKRIMDMATAICGRMEWDFDAVHVVRGAKAAEKGVWPNLEADTAAGAVVEKLKGEIEDMERKVYIATEERSPEYFRGIKEVYRNAFSLDDFRDLWAENSAWYNETLALSGGHPVEFDGYMRIEVDTEVALRAKRKFETFGFLTSDCKDGINTC